MNVESSIFVNVLCLVLLVIYVLCKLHHRKKKFLVCHVIKQNLVIKGSGDYSDRIPSS